MVIAQYQARDPLTRPASRMRGIAGHPLPQGGEGRKYFSTNLQDVKLPPRCHSEPFAVILSEAKNLALPAQDKLRE